MRSAIAVEVNGTPRAIKETLSKKRTCRPFVKEERGTDVISPSYVAELDSKLDTRQEKDQAGTPNQEERPAFGLRMHQAFPKK